MSKHKEHWKQKKRRHDCWIAKAKAANKVLDAPNTLDKDPTALFSNPHQFPTCECEDDGNRILFYQVEESKKGYHIHILCVLCLKKGSQIVAWDPIGEEIVTYLFSRMTPYIENGHRLWKRRTGYRRENG